MPDGFKHTERSHCTAPLCWAEFEKVAGLAGEQEEKQVLLCFGWNSLDCFLVANSTGSLSVNSHCVNGCVWLWCVFVFLYLDRCEDNTCLWFKHAYLFCCLYFAFTVHLKAIKETFTTETEGFILSGNDVPLKAKGHISSQASALRAEWLNICLNTVAL